MLSITISSSFPKTTLRSPEEKDSILFDKSFQDIFHNFYTAYKVFRYSDFTKAYLVLFENKPVFILEIHDATKRDMTSIVPVTKGDLALLIIFYPANAEYTLNAFVACLQAIFDHAEVNRIFFPLYKNNTPEILAPLLKATGFGSACTKEHDRVLDLYVGTRDLFKTAIISRTGNAANKPCDCTL